jgi:hypothetical protein
MMPVTMPQSAMPSRVTKAIRNATPPALSSIFSTMARAAPSEEPRGESATARAGTAVLPPEGAVSAALPAARDAVVAARAAGDVVLGVAGASGGAPLAEMLLTVVVALPGGVADVDGAVDAGAPDADCAADSEAAGADGTADADAAGAADPEAAGAADGEADAAGRAALADPSAATDQTSSGAVVKPELARAGFGSVLFEYQETPSFPLAGGVGAALFE